MSEGFLEGGRLEEEEEEEEEEGVEPEPEAASILGPEDTLESLDENTAVCCVSWELIGGPGGGPESQARNAAPGARTWTN